MKEISKIKFLFSISSIVLFVYGIRSLSEPDIWWQMRTGEWIWSHHKVPTIDFISFTFEGEPWMNIKWLSEVLFYLVGNYIDPTAINVLCGFVFVLIAFVLYLRTKATYKSYSFLYAFLFFGFIVSIRMNGRPEMFSYLFSALYLFLFQKSTKNIHWLWGIILMQLLWCNMHEAFGVGLVMVVVFSIINLLDKEIQNKWMYILFMAACIAVTLINPRGLELLTYVYKIYGQLEENKFTSEMVGWNEDLYWNIFTILNSIVFCISTLYIYFQWKNHKDNFKNSVPYYEVIIYIMFFYLSLKSNRNIVFFQIIAFPYLIGGLEIVAPNWVKKHLIAGIGTTLIVYVFIVSGAYYGVTNKNNQYGLSVHPEKTPIGAYAFVHDSIKGKKVFTDFLSVNYGLWSLRPEFKSYIDLRDLDVFTPAFFKNCYRLYEQPDVLLKSGMTLWDFADSIDQFAYVVLLNNEGFVPLHNYLLRRESKYQLVYADPLASVYQKNKGNSIIKKDWFHPYTFYDHKLAWINFIFNPFWINPKDRIYDYQEMKAVWEQTVVMPK